MKKEVRWFFIGIIFILILILLFSLTLLFKSQLIEYSGITTFYSLLFLIFLFIVKEVLDRQKLNSEGINSLKIIFRITEQIQNNLDYYSESLSNQTVPIYSISSYGNLPDAEICSKDTLLLSEQILSVNDKIFALNEFREELNRIILDCSLNEKERTKAIERYLSFMEETKNSILNELKEALKKIKLELKKWGIN
jgi:hypothetical protein